MARQVKFTPRQQAHVDALCAESFQNGKRIAKGEVLDQANARGVAHAVAVNARIQKAVSDLCALIADNSPTTRQ